MTNEWSSRRSPVYATHGVVASSQPLASEIGLSILKEGGNAADAAVGVAAALGVTQPMSTGLGGDMFCLFYDAKLKTVSGINGSGRCPAGLSIEMLKELGFSEGSRPDEISPFWVTVPGAAAGWVDTLDRFGSKNLTLGQILEPAISLAENGHPVNVITAHFWKESEEKLLSVSPGGRDLLINGRAPRPGQVIKMPFLANTLRRLGAEGKKGFYEGPVAESIVKLVKERGGVLSLEDLTSHNSTFEEPILVNYRGFDIYECAPNGQGITALIALNILEEFDVSALERNSAEHLHLMIESLRLAFSDSRHYVSDPKFTKVPTCGLLSKDYASERRKLIMPRKASTGIEHGYPDISSNTVYFCIVDEEGNACSFINSIYYDFGTFLVPAECGFALQNRGNSFSLSRTHPNCLEPKKRPYHTIIPGMILKDGELWGPFGVMGGAMQPQGHVQVLSNMIDFDLDPQQALDSPRFRISDGTAHGRILLENGISEACRKQLIKMGHNIEPSNSVSDLDRAEVFGLGQIILRDPRNGVFCAGSDSRHDGMAIGW